MPDYLRNEIVDILLSLGACRGRYRAAARYYRQNYPGRLHYPNHRRIRIIEQRERRRPRIPRNRRRIMTQNYDDPRILVVLAMVDLDPHISLRDIQRRTGIPKSTAGRILRLHRFHPYHITLTQALMPDDPRRRLEFCNWAQARIREVPDFFRYVMFSDEATFHGDGQLNRHNSHYWSVQNPHWVRHLDHQHRWSLVVWCGIVNGYLIGPYFFDGNVNGAAYLHFLQNELPRLLEDVDLETRRRLWLQHDGAPCHRSLIVRGFLNQRYPRRWIGIGSNVTEWPPRSPDLTSPDFFLWGYLKNVVYAQQPTTRQDMMQRITQACRALPRYVLLSTVENFQRRIQHCIHLNGGIFEQLMR